MEVAANCSLRVKRPLLDPRFEGYKLSLEPLPCYQLELDAAVAEVKLRDDQYTLEHMHAFGMYNYLHCDSWFQDSVYYIDNLGRIMNLTVMLVQEMPNIPISRSNKYEIIKRDILRGKSVPHYAAIESDGNGLMVVSYKSFTFVQVDQDLEENKDEIMSEKIKEPLYYWQQTEDDLTVTIRLPQDSNKEDVQVQFLPDRINIVVKGQRLLEGNLYSSIDHESSTWTMKDNSLEISLIKKSEGLTWPELIVGDKQGELIRDSAQCAAIAERLMHLTSEELNPNPDKEKPPCNAQELEECDIFFEESSSLCRFDGITLKTTHVVNLGSNQYLFSVIVDPKEMPCFCLRHDVDALLWQPHSSKQGDMWEHIATFNALGYVQASKRDKKFFACAPNYSYAALCECLRRVFIYRQPTPMSTVLYNRKEGRQIGQVAKQQVASIETNDPILGFQATNERLFVLTTKNLFLIKVNTEN
ncbi:PREDICTED: nudC domain-containing protein 1 [Condylura cristata]|uniref:nudC domain-containing protein 1 n=1 Tax=Condylura cristata TaxID=143302 RepID=UPI000334328A|nr:PREDICTED: nudC domain-containing protein 1 [Condylura cristata]